MRFTSLDDNSLLPHLLQLFVGNIIYDHDQKGRSIFPSSTFLI
jgi:hypothetical protein